jgi:hypothetical protein
VREYHQNSSTENRFNGCTVFRCYRTVSFHNTASILHIPTLLAGILVLYQVYLKIRPEVVALQYHSSATVRPIMSKRVKRTAETDGTGPCKGALTDR